MQFKPGFRFSVLDAIILVVASCLAFFVNTYDYHYSILVIFVVFHFFLFCNIIRMSRIPELIWSALFLCIFYLHLELSVISFIGALAFCVLVTFVLTFLELRKPGYHGVFWNKINPELPGWFSKNQNEKT